MLRDIQASYGAVRLTELHRFTDPSEAAATLALRDGRPEALGFYLDRRRVHVGDPTTTLDAVFNAWQADRSRGLDAIMLAPTRELVSRLNQRRNCATPNAVPATRRTTTRPFDQQPPVRRLAPPLAGRPLTRLQVNFPISWPPSGTPPRA